MIEIVRHEIRKIYVDGSFNIEIIEMCDSIGVILWNIEYGDRETLFVVSNEHLTIEQVAIMVDANMCYYKDMYNRLYKYDEEEGGEENEG